MTEQTIRATSRLLTVFTKIIIAVSPQVDQKQLDFLKQQKQVVIVEGGVVEKGYNQIIKGYLGMATEEPVLVGMWDKLLHWAEVDYSELKTIRDNPDQGCTILGRTVNAWRTYPDSWVATEFLVNKLANKLFDKDNWDWFVGIFIFNRRASRIIVDQGIKGFDFMFLWPYLVKKAKLGLGYKEYAGLSFEDPDRFTKEIHKLGKGRWLNDYYDGLKEWGRRINNLQLAIAALEKTFRQ